VAVQTSKGVQRKARFSLKRSVGKGGEEKKRIALGGRIEEGEKGSQEGTILGTGVLGEKQGASL